MYKRKSLNVFREASESKDLRIESVGSGRWTYKQCFLNNQYLSSYLHDIWCLNFEGFLPNFFLLLISSDVVQNYELIFSFFAIIAAKVQIVWQGK